MSLPTPAPLERRLARAFLAASVVPALATAVILTGRNAEQHRAANAGRLVEVAQAVCRATEAYVEQHVAGVAVLAQGTAAGALRPEQAALSARLAAFHRVAPGFRTVLAADAAGRIVAGSPALAAGAPLRSVSDRGYFRVPMATGRPHVSDAFLGRGFGTDPVVAVSAPVLDAAGRPAGIVEGSFDLAKLGQFGRTFAPVHGTTYVVLDARERLIHASAPGLSPLTSLHADRVVRAFHDAVAGGTGGGAPDVRTVAGAGEGGDGVVAARCGTRHGWTVIVERPLASLARDQRELYLLGLGVAAGMGVAAALWGRTIARRIAGPIAALAAAVRGGGARATVPPAAPPGRTGDQLAVASAIGRGRRLTDSIGPELLPVAPPDAPAEVHALGAQLAAYERRVREADRALRQALAEREAEIAERTRALGEANAALTRLASTDALTGLLNRRGFEALAERELATAWRTGTPCLVCYGDLDGFKGINDTHGHAAGDAALGEIADLLRDVFRVADVVGRLGGDEFAVLVYGAGPAEETRVRERMAERLAAANAAAAASGARPFALAATFGIAAVVPPVADVPAALDAPSLGALLREADADLYRRKRRARMAIVA